MAKKRILVVESGKIGKLPPPEETGSSKNDGGWGAPLITWAANISDCTWWQWGLAGEASHPMHRHIASFYLFHFSLSMSISDRGSKGSRDTLKFKKKSICRRKWFNSFCNDTKCRKVLIKISGTIYVWVRV